MEKGDQTLPVREDRQKEYEMINWFITIFTAYANILFPFIFMFK